MPANRVFLSHSSIDRPFVDRLAFDLERVNVGVWYDKWEIRVGDSLIEKISQGIESSDYLAIVLSPDSVKSEWVKREVNAALIRELEEKEVVILPILITDCEIPILLREKKYADFRKSYEDGFEELLFAVSPESPVTISRSKNFRTTQYLISGLASTDDNGTNTLNVAQLRKIYPYRQELQAFLGTEEKRLLFWSALAFGYANSQTPRFMDVTTPVWGLVASTTSEQHAMWILDGLRGVLFEYLIPYYRWARDVLELSDTEHLKKAFLIRQSRQSDFPSALGPISPEAMLEFERVLAEDDREIFDNHFLTNAHKDMPGTPMAIESTAYFASSLDDAFYLSFIGSQEPVALAAFKALARLRRPTAVSFLKTRFGSGKIFSVSALDIAFSKLGHAEFVPELRKWLEHEPPIEIRARILVPLANADAADRNKVIEVMKQVAGSQYEFDLMPTLVRAYGRIGCDPKNLLGKWISKWAGSSRPILCEAAVFALGRVAGPNSLSALSELLKSDSEIILAATMETLAKIGRMDVYDKVKIFSNHESVLVQSAFYRTLVFIKPPDWESYIPLSNEQHPLVRLCAARAFAQLATPADLNRWLDEFGTDELLRVTADEMLFSPRPFAPEWIAHPNQFNAELARLRVRITNLDPDYVWLDTHLDLDRQVHVHVVEYA
jgi:hypothetical protein